MDRTYRDSAGNRVDLAVLCAREPGWATNRILELTRQVDALLRGNAGCAVTADVALTYFPSLRQADGQRIRTTWERLVERLSAVREVADKHEAPGVSLATYAGDRRSLANVERVYAVGLDLDHFDVLPIKMKRTHGLIIDAPTWESVTERFSATDSFAHTTWSSTTENVRVRVFLRLSTPVSGDEYRRVYTACADQVERYGFLVDRAASDPSRFWFLPSIPPGGVYRYSVGRGKPVNVRNVLASYPAAPPAPVAPPPTREMATPDIEDRAARYLDRCDPAITGQDGHKTTFLTCQRIVRGFGLDEETAYRLLCAWNARCDPPWSERELRRKIREAAERGTMTWGELRDRDRAA